MHILSKTTENKFFFFFFSFFYFLDFSFFYIFFGFFLFLFFLDFFFVCAQTKNEVTSLVSTAALVPLPILENEVTSLALAAASVHFHSSNNHPHLGAYLIGLTIPIANRIGFLSF